MSVKRLSTLCLFLALAAPLAAQPPGPPPPPNPPMTSPPMGPSPKATMRDGKTLYQRIGGYDVIADAAKPLFARVHIAEHDSVCLQTIEVIDDVVATEHADLQTLKSEPPCDTRNTLRPGAWIGAASVRDQRDPALVRSR